MGIWNTAGEERRTHYAALWKKEVAQHGSDWKFRKLKEANCDKGRDRWLQCTGDDSESHLFLKYIETQRWRGEVLKSKWVYINEAIAIRKILTVKNATWTEKLRYPRIQYLMRMEKSSLPVWENRTVLVEGGRGDNNEIVYGIESYKQYG